MLQAASCKSQVTSLKSQISSHKLRDVARVSVRILKDEAAFGFRGLDGDHFSHYSCGLIPSLLLIIMLLDFGIQKLCFWAQAELAHSKKTLKGVATF
jgi:hypothetical protein